MQWAGFVLTGGRSTRMGHDKARLLNGSRLLVETVAETVKDIAGSVALIGAAERYRDLPFECLDDARPGRGPLSGIETALASGRGELNLIVACDMPALSSVPWQQLVEEAKTNSVRCVVIRDALGKIHPLCGVWRSSCLGDVRRALDENRLRVSELIEEMGAVIVDVTAVVPNINTPGDWQEWRSVLARGR